MSGWRLNFWQCIPSERGMHRHLSRVLPDRGRPAAARAAHAPDWARCQCAREVSPPVSEDMRTAPATLASATRSQCTPRSHRIAYTLEVLRAEVLKIEEIAFYAEKGLDRLIIIFCPLAVQDR